jgi:hypothetical protein
LANSSHDRAQIAGRNVHADPLRDDPRFEKLLEEAKKPVALK